MINTLHTQRTLENNSQKHSKWHHHFQNLKRKITLSHHSQGFINCLGHQADPSFNYSFGNTSNQGQLYCPSNHFEHDFFCKGYSALSKTQRQNYLIKILEHLDFLENSPASKETMIKKITQYNCLFSTKKCLISKWQEAKISLSFQLKKIILQTQDGIIHLKMKQYLPRTSKVHTSHIIFQFIGPVKIYDFVPVRISCKQQNNEKFNQLYNQLQKISAEIQAKELYRISKINKDASKELINKTQIYVFITPQQIGINNLITEACQEQRHILLSNRHQYDHLQPLSMVAELSSVEQTYKIIKDDQRIKIKVSIRNDHFYKAQIYVTQMPKFMNINNFIDKYSNNHQMVFRVKTMEQCIQQQKDQQKLTIISFYQKIIWKQKIYSQLLNIHQISDNQPQQQQILMLKNIQPQQNCSFIQSMEIKSSQYTFGKYVVDFQVLFSRKRPFTHQSFVNYLEGFQQTFDMGSILSSNRQTRRLSRQILELFATDTKLESNHNKKNKTHHINTLLNTRELISINTSRIDNVRLHEVQPTLTLYSTDYLKHYYSLYPSLQKKGILMTEHFLWKNWKRDQKGGLVCKDQELVARQKKMAKIVASKFGQSLLRGKNIINFSLPVIIFKKQSHLESISHTYLFSPVFIQKSALMKNPLDRMKNAIIMMTTQNALSIYMQKPFNPILGQTYQGFIDGCPIYIEQISHHPPVSYYYMLGRGYKKYGSIQPKVEVGFNKGSGYSLNPQYIQYEDGMKIEYIVAKIVIGGLLVGQRTFKFQQKMYAYDRKNRCFASIKFGPIEDGFFSSSSEPQDYFHGYIYEVTPQFQEYFDAKIPRRHPLQKYIISIQAKIDGIWNSYVRIDNEQVVNFMTDRPYHFQFQNYPLPSDSRYREDRTQLLKGDMQKAQEAKDQGQQIQRNDRKLREQYKKQRQKQTQP